MVVIDTGRMGKAAYDSVFDSRKELFAIRHQFRGDCENQWNEKARRYFGIPKRKTFDFGRMQSSICGNYSNDL